MNGVVDHIGPEAGDVVRKAGRDDRMDLFVAIWVRSSGQLRPEIGRTCANRHRRWTGLTPCARVCSFLARKNWYGRSVGRRRLGKGTDGLLGSARMASRVTPIDWSSASNASGGDGGQGQFRRQTAAVISAPRPGERHVVVLYSILRAWNLNVFNLQQNVYRYKRLWEIHCDKTGHTTTKTKTIGGAIRTRACMRKLITEGAAITRKSGTKTISIGEYYLRF